ncbi:MAG: hypothetical protein EOO24_28795 [Comamonadaceae bacterium]|nr:MAG: hypothetical protein EOO24_28795 [Comamonadaceae bacterium]
MSIERLRQVAEQKLPVNVSDAYEVDEVQVLMTAGLIAGWRLRVDEDGARTPWAFRVLAITPAGRQLLRRSAENMTA